MSKALPHFRPNINISERTREITCFIPIKNQQVTLKCVVEAVLYSALYVPRSRTKNA